MQSPWRLTALGFKPDLPSSSIYLMITGGYGEARVPEEDGIA